METTPERHTLGLQVSRSEWVPFRSVVSGPEVTASGNIVLRVGREHADGWSQTEHVVLTPDEAHTLVGAISTALQADDIAALVEIWREDDARMRYGDDVVDQWFRDDGWDVEAMRADRSDA